MWQWHGPHLPLHALEDIAEMTAPEVLPALKLLCLEDEPASSIHKYLALRRDSGYPVTFVNTFEDFGGPESWA